MAYRRISTGDGASMPWCDIADLSRILRYHSPSQGDLLVAASIVEAYEYLVRGVSLKEATRRLSIVRKYVRHDRIF